MDLWVFNRRINHIQKRSTAKCEFKKSFKAWERIVYGFIYRFIRLDIQLLRFTNYGSDIHKNSGANNLSAIII